MTEICIPEEIKPLFSQHIDQHSFDTLKQTKIETIELPWEDKWHEDVVEHIKRERENLLSQPELCFYHTALIIRIRRKIACDTDFKAFDHLWNVEHKFLIQHLSSRWLISALNTFIDLGSFKQQAFAMPIMSIMNCLKIAETEYKLCGTPAYIPDKMKDNRDHYPPIWDGRKVFHFGDDDTLGNMLSRIRTFVKEDPVFDSILFKLLDEALKGGSILERFRQAHDHNLYLDRVYPEFKT